MLEQNLGQRLLIRMEMQSDRDDDDQFVSTQTVVVEHPEFVL